MKTNHIYAVDLFCGAGGTSSGLMEAADELRLKVNLTAVNHWAIAIATHSANHTHAQHLCASLDKLYPPQVVPGGRLHLLVASPECTNHSNARGNKPRNDQSRTSAWQVLRWLELLKVDNLLLENVPQFLKWGPLATNGLPIESRKGETFQAFIQALRSLGYTVDYRVLNAADYGDATTRERLFIMARKGRRGITWPTPTHTSDTSENLFKKLLPWRSAREIIDWKIPGKSIFKRKKALSPNTMRRIEAGLKKFCGPEIAPFLVILRGQNKGLCIDQPVPTITAGGNHMGLCQPFLIKYYGTACAQSVDEPLPAVVTKDRFGICEPFIVGITQTGSGPNRVRSINRPLPTVVTKEELALCEPFILGQQSGSTARSVNQPVPTVSTAGAIALVQPEMKGQRLDIRFRMLQPHELAAAQSFKADYKFTGTRVEQVKQIGNAVPTQLAKALCRAALEVYAS
jgi:DNA (cytosine-5)-methyltransferase 1